MFEQLSGYAKFKADFHHVYIRVRKDPDKKWFNLPYLAIDDVIAEVIKCWPTKWHSTSDEAIRTSKSWRKRKRK